MQQRRTKEDNEESTKIILQQITHEWLCIYVYLLLLLNSLWLFLVDLFANWWILNNLQITWTCFQELYSGLIDNTLLWFMQLYFIAWEDKNGGNESFAGLPDCPTHHLSASAAMQSFSLNITNEVAEVCGVTRHSVWRLNDCQSPLPHLALLLL